MSTHGWEDDDDFVAYGIRRDSPEGRAYIAERDRRELKVDQEAAARKAEWANPLRRYEILAAHAAELAARRHADEVAVAARTADLAQTNADLAACLAELAATKAEVIRLMGK
jgi:hypothetical protein